MGPIILPLQGSVYVDTNGFINTVEKITPFYAQLLPFWQAIAAQQAHVVTSELTLFETLILPLRASDAQLVQAYRDVLLGSPDLTLRMG